MDQNDSPSRISLSRRSFLTRAGVVAAGSALAVAGVQRAEAARKWCAMDPIVVIDNKLADIFLSSDLKLLLAATGPSVIRVGIPVGSKGTVILNDLGFGLKGYDIKFVTDSTLESTKRHTEVSVKAFVPSKDPTLPLQVTFAPRSLDSSLKQILFGDSAEGMVNEWVHLRV
jgi:hypothetical protein